MEEKRFGSIHFLTIVVMIDPSRGDAIRKRERGGEGWGGGEERNKQSGERIERLANTSELWAVLDCSKRDVVSTRFNYKRNAQQLARVAQRRGRESLEWETGTKSGVKKKKKKKLKRIVTGCTYTRVSEVEVRTPSLSFSPLSSSEFLTFHQAGEPRETQFAHSWDGKVWETSGATRIPRGKARVYPCAKLHLEERNRATSRLYEPLSISLSLLFASIHPTECVPSSSGSSRLSKHSKRVACLFFPPWTDNWAPSPPLWTQVW